MESIPERYRRVAAAFVDTVAAVPTARWDDSSPCEGWSARDVVGHVVQSQGLFLGFVGLGPDAGPDVVADPLGAVRAATGSVQAALDDPATREVTYQGFGGEMTFVAGVGAFLVPDLVVHRWDLARATGGDESVDHADVAMIRNQMAEWPEELMRSPQAFGPAVEPPPGADEWQQLLAFLGRRP